MGGRQSRSLELQLFKTKLNTFSTVYLRSDHLTNLHTCIFNNIETEVWYHLKFLQNYSLSFIPASFSVGLIDIRWRWSVMTFSSVARLGSFSRQIGLLLEDVQAVLPDLAVLPYVQGNTFVVPSVQLILHFCIFSNALCFSFSDHFIYFQPFTFS